jgi:hypothetical protein
LDVLSKLALTYMPPENPELRAKILADPEGLSIQQNEDYSGTSPPSMLRATPSDSPTEIGNSAKNLAAEPQLTPNQKNCQGVWEGLMAGQRFNFCLQQTGHFVEGNIQQGDDVTLFTGSYNAPVLRFEKTNADGTDVLFVGILDATGRKFIGTCSNYASSVEWSAILTSSTVSASSLSQPIRQLISDRQDERTAAAVPVSVTESVAVQIPIEVPTPVRMLAPAPVPVPESQPDPDAEAFQQPAENLCPNCQSSLNPAFQFCLHCGRAQPT